MPLRETSCATKRTARSWTSSSQKAAARPLATPPIVPTDQVKALRTAFKRMIGDEQFKADAKAQKLDIDPAGAEEIDKVIELFATTPDEIGQKLKAAISPKG